MKKTRKINISKKGQSIGFLGKLLIFLATVAIIAGAIFLFSSKGKGLLSFLF